MGKDYCSAVQNGTTLTIAKCYLLGHSRRISSRLGDNDIRLGLYLRTDDFAPNISVARKRSSSGQKVSDFLWATASHHNLVVLCHFYPSESLTVTPTVTDHASTYTVTCSIDLYKRSGFSLGKGEDMRSGST